MASTGKHGTFASQGDKRRLERGNPRYEVLGKDRNGGHGVLGVLLGILIGVAVVIVLLAAMLVPSLLTIRSEASTLSSAASDLVASMKSEGSGEIGTDIETIRDSVSALEQSLNGPVWSILTIIPVYGQDVVNARRLLASANDLVEGALVPLSDTLEAYPLDVLVSDGSINGDALQAYCDVLADQVPTIQEALAAIGEVGEFRISQIEEVVEPLRTPAALLADLLESSGDAIRLLPDMLGCNGARNYLVIAQNNVEVRATGGYPGAMTVVTVDNGSISYGDVMNSDAIAANEENPIPITEEEGALFSPSLGLRCGCMNMTPDFSRAAQIWSQGWLRDYGLQVDGVIATDPVLFGRILELTGKSVTLSDGTYVDGENFATELMHDTYWDFSWSDYDSETANELMDARFAEAAGDCIALLKESVSDIDLSDLLEVLSEGIDEGRLLGWMYRAEEQSVMESLGCDGTLNSDVTEPVLGVYLNDDTWSKISWWLDLSTEITSTVANEDGTTTYYMTTTLTNTISYEEANAASSYITGYVSLKRDSSDAVTWIYLVSPVGGTISDVQVSGSGMLEISESPYQGHQVYFGRSQLLSNESVTLTYTVTTSAEAQSGLTVHQTPLARE